MLFSSIYNSFLAQVSVLFLFQNATMSSRGGLLFSVKWAIPGFPEVFSGVDLVSITYMKYCSQTFKMELSIDNLDVWRGFEYVFSFLAKRVSKNVLSKKYIGNNLLANIACKRSKQKFFYKDVWAKICLNKPLAKIFL